MCMTAQSRKTNTKTKAEQLTTNILHYFVARHLLLNPHLAQICIF